MNAKTEQQLNKRIEKLEAELEAAEAEAREAEEKVENFQNMIDDGRDTWSQPRDWDEKDLPVPRLEMHWSRDDDEGYNCRCLYVLVYRHLLDDVKRPKLVANPMGLTRSNGRRGDFFFSERIDTPFRDGAHALSDAFQLKIPLYITTEDGDVDEVIFADGAKTFRDNVQIVHTRVKK